MSIKHKSDRNRSIASDEYIWDIEGLTGIHKLVTEPVIKKLNSISGNHILDLGCGNGSFTHMLSSKGYSMVGMDYSFTGIEIAKKQFPLIHFEQHDAQTTLSQEHFGKYDAVISIEVIEHLLLPRKMVGNAYNALKPGGLFILTTPFHGYWKNLALAVTNKFDDHWHPLRDFGHIKFFSKSTILELFDEFNFQSVSFSTVGRIPLFAWSMVVSAYK